MENKRKFGFVERYLIPCLVGLVITQMVLLMPVVGYTKAVKEKAEASSSIEGVNYICLDNNLYYDENTCIVYIRHFAHQSGVLYLPYYASNGKPYYFNKETNKLEMISDCNNCEVCNNGSTE